VIVPGDEADEVAGDDDPGPAVLVDRREPRAVDEDGLSPKSLTSGYESVVTGRR
jgi:hypothetical protein